MLALFFIFMKETGIGKSVGKIVRENACQDNGNAMTNALINQKLAKTSANQVKAVLFFLSQ